jgi:hypothetical protein
MQGLKAKPLAQIQPPLLDETRTLEVYSKSIEHTIKICENEPTDES